MKELILVNPQCQVTSAEAQQAATHGAYYLFKAKIVKSLHEVRGMCDVMVAFSARAASAQKNGRNLLRVPLSLRLLSQRVSLYLLFLSLYLLSLSLSLSLFSLSFSSLSLSLSLS